MSDERKAERRCERTGNPCGTDTWMAGAGNGCHCSQCIAWRDDEIDRLRERIEVEDYEILQIMRERGWV